MPPPLNVPLLSLTLSRQFCDHSPLRTLCRRFSVCLGKLSEEAPEEWETEPGSHSTAQLTIAPSAPVAALEHCVQEYELSDKTGSQHTHIYSRVVC